MKAKFLVPIGSDDDDYFYILEKYKEDVGGIYIDWPGAPSGRVNGDPSKSFFNKIFTWCRGNNKTFDILFNMQAHNYASGFNAHTVDLSSYKYKNTELTFSSVILYREKAFDGFKRKISANYKLNLIQQLCTLHKELVDLKYIVVDRDINRNQGLVNKIYNYANSIGVDIDIMVNEGCLSFCPNKIDHNIFITLAKYSEQDKYLCQSKEICYNAFIKNFSNILKSPFLTREALKNCKCRFFKIVGRRKPVRYIDNILDYYIHGKPIDMGIAFTNMSLKTGITTNMLPASFHKKILYCKNECYKCNFCSKIYKDILKKYRVKPPDK